MPKLKRLKRHAGAVDYLLRSTSGKTTGKFVGKKRTRTTAQKEAIKLKKAVNAIAKLDGFVTAKQFLQNQQGSKSVYDPFCTFGADWVKLDNRYHKQWEKYKKSKQQKNRGVPKEYKKKVLPYTKWLNKLKTKPRRKTTIEKYQCGAADKTSRKRTAGLARPVFKTQIARNRLFQ